MAAMFSNCQRLWKDGRLIVKDGKLGEKYAGEDIAVSPDFDRRILKDLKNYFDTYSTVTMENYGMGLAP
ncbi:MAG: hypothetical protein JSR78_11225 [Proteobacteria bacterium]|nr:hypothetical protein [Pseudomonadota bacterium]